MGFSAGTGLLGQAVYGPAALDAYRRFLACQ